MIKCLLYFLNEFWTGLEKVLLYAEIFWIHYLLWSLNVTFCNILKYSSVVTYLYATLICDFFQQAFLLFIAEINAGCSSSNDSHVKYFSSTFIPILILYIFQALCSFTSKSYAFSVTSTR